MSQPTLMAEPRDVVGKKVKRLRKEGLLPAVIYGPAMEDTSSITVDQKTFIKLFMRYGHSTLIELELDGTVHTVFIREVQMNPVRRDPIHVDFFAPNLRKIITSPVPLALQNTPEGPGVFQTLLSEVMLEGLPREIPSRIVVDCSNLKAIGDTIRVGDLDIPNDVTLMTNPDEMVASLIPQAEEPGEEETVVDGVDLETLAGPTTEEEAESESAATGEEAS
jgi:large subunit ribosomal protein L25